MGDDEAMEEFDADAEPQPEAEAEPVMEGAEMEAVSGDEFSEFAEFEEIK